MDVEDVVPGGKVGFKDFQVALLGKGTGGGEGTRPEHVVKPVAVEGLKIHVGLDRLGVHTVGHGDITAIPVGLGYGGRYVGVGIGVKF